MAANSDQRKPPHLVGYESWLYQMPCIRSSGDVFVSVPLPIPKNTERAGEPLNRWLVAVGNISGRGESASRLRDSLETEVIRLAGTMSDPASILKTLNNDLIDPTPSSVFATLWVTVIDSDRCELTIANAGNIPPLIRRADRRVEWLAEEIAGFPLWIDPGQTYQIVTVPLGPGDVVIFYSDEVAAAIIDQSNHFDLEGLRQAIGQAPDGAESVGQSVLDAIRRSRSGPAQEDDITLLCLGRVVPTTHLGGTASE